MTLLRALGDFHAPSTRRQRLAIAVLLGAVLLLCGIAPGGN